MTKTTQMKTSFSLLLAALILTLPGCFAQEPDVYLCTRAKPGCPDGQKCDFLRGECVPEDAKLDGRVDGKLADAGKDMAADRGKDMAADKSKDMAADMGMDVGADLIDGPVPDKAADMAADMGMDVGVDLIDGPVPDKAADMAADMGNDITVQPDKPALDLPVQDQKSTSDQGGIVPATWVTIKAGTFQMGSPDGTGTQTKEPCRQTDEKQHQVTLTHIFEIQTTEVTQDQYFSVMVYKPSKFSSCGGTCPVEQVNWHEAAAYANALSSKAGLTACYTCTGSGKSVTCSEATAYAGAQIYTCPGYRLLTEAEWEYAYRAGGACQRV